MQFIKACSLLFVQDMLVQNQYAITTHADFTIVDLTINGIMIYLHAHNKNEHQIHWPF